MLTLAATLTAHQRGRSRRPAVLAYVTHTRFASPVLHFAAGAIPAATTAAPIDVECQVNAVADPFASGAVLAIRNNAGALDYSIGYPSPGTWANLDTVTSGQGFALAYDSVANQYLLAYGDGNDLKVRTTATGAVWSGATTLVTEASAIGSVAVAVDTAGDACVFYTLGTTTTLKRLRRTAGVWAVSGTTWSKTASVASLTGLSARWKNDYYLCITGTEVTTNHRRLWAVTMGDTSLPANVWSGFSNVAEADAGSGTTFLYPSLLAISDISYVVFSQVESGNVAGTRVFMAHAMPVLGHIGNWTEPAPTSFTPTYGAALAHWPVGDANYSAATGLYTNSQSSRAYQLAAAQLGDRLVALSWKMTPESFRLRLELENNDGLAGAAPAALQPAPGLDLVIQHGYVSSAAVPPIAEYGLQLRCLIRRVSRVFEPGRSRLIIEADGPWEALSRFHAVQAWTAPASTTRAAIFQRIAARAGLVVSNASAPRAPSTAWTTDTPAFTIAANERGDTTLRRLLAPTPDFLRQSALGGFEICGFSDTTSQQDYSVNHDPSNVRHPAISVTDAEELEPNWLRLQGPDRYADSAYFQLTAGAQTEDPAIGPIGAGPWFALLRDADAGTDAKAIARAIAGLRRIRQVTPRGQLIAPAHVGQELYDVVASYHTIIVGAQPTYTSRVVGLSLDYKRAPASGAPAYTTTLDLADKLVFE